MIATEKPFDWWQSDVLMTCAPSVYVLQLIISVYWFIYSCNTFSITFISIDIFISALETATTCVVKRYVFDEPCACAVRRCRWPKGCVHKKYKSMRRRNREGHKLLTTPCLTRRAHTRVITVTPQCMPFRCMTLVQCFNLSSVLGLVKLAAADRQSVGSVPNRFTYKYHSMNARATSQRRRARRI
jgi:hypothetical protein